MLGESLEVKNLKDLYKLALEENDSPTLDDCVKKTFKLLDDIREFEIKCFLSGEDDNLDIYLEIHAGAGGTESQDWAEMLRRMNLKRFDKKSFKYSMISEHKGDEAGIKSCVLKITGNNLYGLMKKESGVHRLVRISPFDSGARRHTSFASVWVYPCVNDDIDIKIDEKDLRIDTYRSSGAGGQHVNTTDSAVMMVHKPTGISVYCADERSQIKNRAKALTVMRSRLLQAKVDEEHAKYAAERKGQIGTGDRSERIRTYNYPQGRLTDHRIGLSLSLPTVVEGDLNDLIDALQNYDYEARIQNLLKKPKKVENS